jgi:hypothetical protein
VEGKGGVKNQPSLKFREHGVQDDVRKNPVDRRSLRSAVQPRRGDEQSSILQQRNQNRHRNQGSMFNLPSIYQVCSLLFGQVDISVIQPFHAHYQISINSIYGGT